MFSSGVHQRLGVWPDALEAVIDVVEPMGDRDIVDGKKDNVSFTLLAEPEAGARMDKSVTVFFDMNRSHIFDKVSGENLIISS